MNIIASYILSYYIYYLGLIIIYINSFIYQGSTYIALRYKFIYFTYNLNIKL